MRAAMNVIRAILVLIWALLLAGNVLLYIDETVEGHTPPAIKGYACYTVRDEDMRPDLVIGDLAIISTGKAAKPGDAVLYGGGLTRIIGTSEGQLILKADSAETSVLAPEGEIDGVMVTFIPGLGGPAEFMRSLPGLISIGGVGLALIVLSIALTRPAKPREPRGMGRVDRLEPVKPTKAPGRIAKARQAQRERKQEERETSAELDRMGQVGRRSREGKSNRTRGGYKPRH